MIQTIPLSKMKKLYEMKTFYFRPSEEEFYYILECTARIFYTWDHSFFDDFFHTVFSYKLYSETRFIQIRMERLIKASAIIAQYRAFSVSRREMNAYYSMSRTAKSRIPSGKKRQVFNNNIEKQIYKDATLHKAVPVCQSPFRSDSNWLLEPPKCE